MPTTHLAYRDSTMTTTTMDPRVHVGANSLMPQSWTPTTVDSLRNEAAVSSAGLPMIYVVSGPQTRRGTPPPLIEASVVHTALWCMFIVAILNAIVL